MDNEIRAAITGSVGGIEMMIWTLIGAIIVFDDKRNRGIAYLCWTIMILGRMYLRVIGS